MIAQICFNPLKYGIARYTIISLTDKVPIGTKRTVIVATENLSKHQKEVLNGLTQGATTKEMANMLSVSPKTVEFHRSRLWAIFGTTSIVELTHFAIALGLTPKLPKFSPTPVPATPPVITPPIVTPEPVNIKVVTPKPVETIRGKWRDRKVPKTAMNKYAGKYGMACTIGTI